MTEPLEEEYATVRQGFVDAWGIEEYVSECTASSRFYPALDTIQAEHRRLAEEVSHLDYNVQEAERQIERLTIKLQEERENCSRWDDERWRGVGAKLQAITEERDAAREALSFYADESNYDNHDLNEFALSAIDMDDGTHARAALTPQEEG